MRIRFSFSAKYRQDGLASIIVVFIIIIILSLVSLGFSRLMDRAIRQATANNLGAAADYAARSGINQATAYIKGHLDDANPVSATRCNDLIGPGKPLAGLNDLSGNGTTEYTCLLVDSLSVDNLLYKQIPPYRSQVVKLNTSAPLGRLMVSWQSSDRSLNQLPSGSPNLLDETTWGQRAYEPLLRVTLYPIPSNGSLTNNPPKTYFLYPSDIAGTAVTTVAYTTTANGTLQPVDCSNATDTGINFNGAASGFACNVIINLASVSASYYYIRLTPLYNMADVQIQGDDRTSSHNPVKFPRVQYVVDVTARANNAVKRLQARVDAAGSSDIGSSDNAIPEYGIRTSNTICKRLVLQDDGTVTVDAVGGAQQCSLDVPPANAP